METCNSCQNHHGFIKFKVSIIGGNHFNGQMGFRLTCGLILNHGKKSISIFFCREKISEMKNSISQTQRWN